MPITLVEKNDGKVLEIHMTGKLRREDYQKFVPEFELLLSTHGKPCVLVAMVDFHGWEAGALWDDLRFDLRHYADIERIAMVGDKKWEKAMSVVCQPFTTAKIRYFDLDRIPEARAWLEASVGELAEK